MQDKILTVLTLSSRSALGDAYKNIINALPNKKNIIVFIPGAYSPDEFSSDFLKKIHGSILFTGSKRERWAKKITIVRQLNKIIKKYEVNHVFFFWEEPQSQIPLIRLNSKCDYTIWLHDPVLHEGEGKSAYFFRSLAQKFSYPFIDKVIVSYSSAVTQIRSMSEWNCIKNKVHVVYLPQMPELEFSDVKNDINIKEKYDFIFWGRIESYKGIDVLLRAMQDSKMSKVSLLIVGRGRESDYVMEKVKGLHNVTYINRYVENRELATYIKQSKYVVLPYRSATGTQTVMLANYYGKLVLATKVGCFPEYIQEGKNGFFIENLNLCNLVDSMLELMERNPKCYLNQINQVYQSFDIKKIAKQVYSIITF